MKTLLTDQNVRWIMQNRQKPQGKRLTLAQLAERFKVAVPTISHVVYGITHRDITDEKRVVKHPAKRVNVLVHKARK